jgi:small subunit ribosomal protein S5
MEKIENQSVPETIIIGSQGEEIESKILKTESGEEKKSNPFFKKTERGRRPLRSPHIKSEILANKRVVKVTKGGRRFSFTSLVLVKDEEKNSVAFAHSGGKEVMVAFRKSLRKAQKKSITYFPPSTRTIPRDIVVKYKATKLFLKPTPPGSGIKASETLSKLFKFLGIKDVTAKIIGSRRNKLNVVHAAFLALDELTGKRYDY